MKGNKSKIPCGWCKQPLTHAQHKKHYPVCTQRKAELEPLERQSKRPRTLSSSRSINRQTDQRNLERAATHVPQDNTGTVPMNTQEASSRSISTATQEFTGCQLLTSDDDQHDGGFSDYDKPTVQSVQNSPPPTDAEASIVNVPNTEPKVYAFNVQQSDGIIAKSSVKLQAIVDRRNISRAGHEELRNLCNELIAYFDPEHEFMYTPFMSRKETSNFYPVDTKPFDICATGCKMYYNDDSTVCSNCAKPRYYEPSTDDPQGQPSDLRPVAQMDILPIGEQLAYMIHDEKSREQLLYRSQFKHRPGLYRDFFDGAAYQKMKIEDGLFSEDLDIALMLYVDGFQPMNYSHHSMTIMHLVVLNFDPSIRYETKNMLQVGIIPGPESPTDLQSFLQPTLDELKGLEQNGLVVKSGKKEIKAKVHLVGATGDMMGVKTLANHFGPTAKYGCRICCIVGEHNENGYGMYFPDREDVSRQWRNAESFRTGDMERGLYGPCAFADFMAFGGPQFFALDELHLLGHGIARQFFDLLNGSYKSPDTDSNPFAIDIDTVMAEMENARETVPPSFTGAWRSLKGKRRVRSVDWLDFLLYAVPALVVPRLATAEAQEATMALVTACQKSLQYDLTRVDIDDIERGFTTWHTYLLELVTNGILSVSIFTPNQHYLKHIPAMIRQLGPLRYYSTRSMERMVGVYSKAISSTSAPGSNAGNIMKQLAMARYIDPVVESSGQEGDNAKARNDHVFCIDPSDISAPEVWGKLKNQNLDIMDNTIAGVDALTLKRSLLTYLRDKIDGPLNVEFQYGGRLYFKSNKFGSLLSHQRRYRAAYFVRLKMSIDINHTHGNDSAFVYGPQYYFGKVYFYLIHIQDNIARLLAVVGLFSPSIDLDTGSAYITRSSVDRIFVVDATALEDFAGLVTCNHNERSSQRQYLIWNGMVSKNATVTGLYNGEIKDI